MDEHLSVVVIAAPDDLVRKVLAGILEALRIERLEVAEVPELFDVVTERPIDVVVLAAPMPLTEQHRLISELHASQRAEFKVVRVGGDDPTTHAGEDAFIPLEKIAALPSTVQSLLGER